MAYTNRRKIPLTIPVCSANFMKQLGTALMCLYFFGQSVIQHGLLNAPNRTSQELNNLIESSHDAFLLAGTASVCMLVGAAAVPIFAFLLAEGIQNTSNAGRYILNVLVTALLTEIPYDLAVSGKPFNWSDQSFLWTILIALIMLWLMQKFRGKGAAAAVVNIMLIAGGCIWALFLRCKFGAAFVVMTALLFLLWNRRGIGALLAGIVSLVYITAPLGFIPIMLYSGERKNTDKKMSKYGYYILCPVIALVFAVTSALTTARF